MSTILTFISHAPTRAVRNAAFPGNEPLDPSGWAAAATFAGGIRRVDAGWAGPELRTLETAAALCVDAVIEPVLRDIDLGRWAGRTLAAVQAAEPDAVADWINRTDAAPHGGESVEDLIARISPWLGALSAGRKHLAITHPAVIRAAVILAIDAKPSSFWRIDIGPLCRVRLSGNGVRWNLQTIAPQAATARETV